MNNLNSILLEGTLVEDPAHPQMGECSFTIECVRYQTRDDGEKVKETSRFNIRCINRMADVCAESLKKGRGVRVVGRLVQVLEESCFILAEHVEFRPISVKSSLHEATV